MGNVGTNTSGYTTSFALAVNTAGTAVGYAEKWVLDGDKGPRAVRWDASGTVATELANLGTDSGGGTDSQAFALNTAGTTVGFSEKYVSGFYKGTRAVRWDASGTVATELGNLGTEAVSGQAYSRAYAINTAGTAAGFASKYVSGSDKGSRAARWDASGTAATELGNIGTDGDGVTYGVASAINAAGTAVGWAEKYGSGGSKGPRAVRWDASGAVATELGNLGTDSDGIAFSYPYAVNTAGIAVGNAEKWDSNGTFLGQRAVAWGLDGVAIDLNSLLDPGSGWYLYDAGGISDTNWVTGVGYFDPGGGQAAYDRLFLLDITSAVPEPAGLSILALAVLPLLRRRKRVTMHLWLKKSGR